MDTPFPIVESGAQDRFDKSYISSTDICQRMGVSRVQLFARKKKGGLPDGIMVNGAQITLWEREAIEPHLKRWEVDLDRWRHGEPMS